MPIVRQVTTPFTFASFVGGYMSTTDEDPLMVPKQYITECKNLLFENGYLRKALGWTRLSHATFNGIGQSVYVFRTHDNQEEVLFLTTTNLYVWDPDADTMTDITPTGGLNGTTNIAPQIITWMDSVFITNGVDPIMRHLFGTQATFLNTGGAPLAAMSIQTFSGQLFAFAITDTTGFQAWRAVWSDFRNPTIWNAGQAGGVDLDDTQEEIMSAEIIDRWMAIAKTHNWYIVTFLGPPVQFDFRRRDTDGVLARRTLIRLPSGLGLFALGPTDAIIFDGNNSTPVGKPIRKELFTVLNRDSLNADVAWKDELRGRVYLSLATSADTPDWIYTYSYIDGPWMRELPPAGGPPGALGGGLLGGASVDFHTPLLIDEMVFPIDHYDVQIRDLFKDRQQRVVATNGSGLFALGDSLNQDGLPIDARFSTAAIAPGTQQDGTVLPVTLMALIVEGNQFSGISQISVRAWWGNFADVVYGPYDLFFDKPITQVLPVEISGTYFQIIVENANLDQGFQIKQITCRYHVRGRV